MTNSWASVFVFLVCLVSRKQDKILHAPKLGWHNVAVGLILKKVFQVPIFVENDANLEALAQLFLMIMYSLQEK